MTTTMKPIDIAYLMRSLEQALRAGYSLRQAVERVSHDIDGLDTLAAELSDGKDLIGSIEAWVRQRPEPEAGLLLGAIRLQTETHGNFADTLGTLHRVLERR
jgi:Flp pilus assembly protein TadB